MSTRIYNFGRFLSPKSSGTFFIDETSYTYAISVNMGDGNYEVAIDQSDTSGWRTNYSGWQNPYWRIMFSDTFPIYLLKIATSASNPVTLRGYNGSSWVVISTFSGSTILNFNGGVSYSGFQLDTTEGGYTNIYTFNVMNFEAAFIFNTNSITVSGISIDDDETGIFSPIGNNCLEIEDSSIGVISLINYNGLDVDIDTIKSGGRITRNYQVNECETLELLNSRQNTKNGSDLEDYCNLDYGNRNRVDSGIILDDNIAGNRTRNNLIFAVDNDDIVASSNANYKYILTVTPTHQHRSMPITVSLTSRSSVTIIGKYNVVLNNSIIIQTISSYEPMNNIEFTINPSQLTIGLNKTRINLFYQNGTQEYLDFEVVKEEPKRTVAQRLFRDYDGGFSGDYYAPPKILVPSKYPCWMTKENATQGIFKTTEYTRMSLTGYTSVQGVQVVGSGLSILVSFDKGTTWKSFINNVWTSVDIANIATYGMTVNTINSITLAQWTDAFTPTSIDFAVCINNELNPTTTLDTHTMIALPTNYIDNSPFIYNRPSNARITSVTSYFGAYSFFTAYRTVYSNIYPSGYTTLLTGTSTYTALSNELISSVWHYSRTVGNASTGAFNYTIYGKLLDCYLKSITVNMTPSPFTGYAFII